MNRGINMFKTIGPACVALLIILALSACSSTARVSSSDASKKAEVVVEPMLLPPLSAPTSKESAYRDENPAVLALLTKAQQSQNDGDISSATAHVERALRIDPHSSSAYYYIASLKLQQGKVHEALQFAQKALHFEPASSSLLVDVWELVAVCKDALGDPNGARKARGKAQALR